MRLVDANKVTQSIVDERNKIPLTVPCAPYELVKEKPYKHGQAMRGGIRKALRCINDAPTVEAIPIPKEYAAMTNVHDGREYTIDLSIPITKEQFDAIAKGSDIWEVLSE